jgi:hypothetical protein
MGRRQAFEVNGCARHALLKPRVGGPLAESFAEEGDGLDRVLDHAVEDDAGVSPSA